MPTLRSVGFSVPRSHAWARILLAFLASSALATEEDNPFRGVSPPLPPYDPDQSLIVAEPPDGSVLIVPPDRITLYFRRFEFDLVPSSLQIWVDDVEYTEALRFWDDRAWLDASFLQQKLQQASGSHLIRAEMLDIRGLLHEVAGSYTVLPLPCPGGCPWPLEPTAEPKVVANLMEDWQSWGSPYWHSGLDIRAPAGTPVHSSTDGMVVKVINYKTGALYWEVAVQDPVGTIWQYHHLAESSIAVTQGQMVSQGDLLGEVVTWPSSMNGFTYHHLHLNVVRWLGGGALPGPYVDGFLYYNPLNFLSKGTYDDTIFPHEFDVYFAVNENDSAFAADSDPGQPVLNGDIDVIAQLRDRMTTIPPADGQPYELGLYELAYSVEPINTPCGVGSIPRTKLARFNSVPGGTIVASQDQVLHKIYKQTLYHGGGSGTATLYNYGTQQFFYTLTNTHNGFPDDINGFWDTDATPTLLGARHPDGEYNVHVYAKDFYANETVTTVPVTVSNGLDYLGICPNLIYWVKWIDPLLLVTAPGEQAPVQPPPVRVRFGPAMQGSARATLDSSTWPAWHFDLPAAGFRLGIGVLEGNEVDVEYIPYLGDVIFEVPAEAQVLPLGLGNFDPSASSTNPVSLRLSTRLARDPVSGGAHIGQPASLGSVDFSLVMAEPIQVGNQTLMLRTQGTKGSRAAWVLGTSDVGSPPPRRPERVLVEALPNPFNPRVTLKLTVGQETDAVVQVLDVRGRRIRAIYRGKLEAGTTTLLWNGMDDFGVPQASGLYMVRVLGDQIIPSTKKIILLQ